MQNIIVENLGQIILFTCATSVFLVLITLVCCVREILQYRPEADSRDYTQKVKT